MRMSTLLISMMLLSSILVFNVHAEEARRLGINTTFRAFREEIKYIHESGVGAIRVSLLWQLVKIRPGEYDWSTVDRFLKVAQTKQIEVLFTIRTNFSEETRKHKRKRGGIENTPESLDKKERVDFVGALSSRYRGPLALLGMPFVNLPSETKEMIRA